MKKIFPAVDKTVLNKVNESFITKEQFDELVSIVNTYKVDTEKAIHDLDVFKSNLNTQVTTKNIDSETADIDSANINTLTVDKLNATNLGEFIDTIKGIIIKDNASITLKDDEVTISFNKQPAIVITPEKITMATNLLVNDIEANDIKANSAEFDGNVIVHGNAVFDNPPEQKDANLTGVTSIEEEDVKVSRINTAEIEHIKGTEAEIKHIVTDSVEAEEFISKGYTRISHNYRKNEPQEIDANLEDYWIDIPNFKNGEYYLYSELAGREELDWSFEAFNSIDNPMFRWSETELHRIEDVTLLKYADGTARYVLHIRTSNELCLLYSGSNSFNIEKYTTGWNAPTIYNYNPYESEEEYKLVEIRDLKGTYIPNATYAGNFHAEGMIVDNFIFNKLYIKERLGFPIKLGDDEAGFDVGVDGQYVSNVYDEEAQEERVMWKSGVRLDTPSPLGTSTTLVEENAVSNYTGEQITEDEDGNEVSKYNIIHTGDNTTVHGDIKVENNAEIKNELDVGNSAEIHNKLTVHKDVHFPHIYDGTTPTPSMPDDSLVISYGEQIYYKIDTKYYDESITEVEPAGSLLEVTHEWEYYKEDDVLYVGKEDTEGNIEYYKLLQFPDVIEDFPTELVSPDFILCSEVIFDTDATLTRKRTFTIDANKVAKYDDIAVYNKDADWSEERDKKPIVYNKERDALETADSLSIDDLTVDNLKVNNNLDVGHDVRVAGDLYVTGTTHTVNEETIESKSDTIVLREGASHALMPGQESGIIVNNIDGEGNDLSIVTDETGVLRIGVAQGEKTTYTDISYNSHDDKWYSRVYNDDTDEYEYEELSPQPKGELTDEKGKVEDDPYTDYDEVTFTVIDKESLQPVLTREEEHDSNDEGLLKYNKETHRAETLSLPTLNNQSLSSKYNEDTGKWEYEWGNPSAGIFRFETVADYQEALAIEEGQEGYIPSGSIIVIDGNYNHTLGED